MRFSIPRGNSGLKLDELDARLSIGERIEFY